MLKKVCVVFLILILLCSFCYATEEILKNSSPAFASYYKDTLLGRLVELENEDLNKKYNFLFKTKEKKEANAFLQAMEDTINQQLEQKNAEEFLKKLTKDENGNYNNKEIMNYLNTTLKGGTAGFISFFEGLEAWFKNDQIYSRA